jgi:hypothetical protein
VTKKQEGLKELVYKQSYFFSTSDSPFRQCTHFIKYQKLGIAFLEIVSNIIESVRKRVLINIHLSPPNQSLKLTEGAVDDFARAKQPATIGHDLARADWIPSLRPFVAAA